MMDINKLPKLPVMNLQLFAEEKTEKPTPKKKKDARERGQVLKSADLTSALLLLAIFGTFKLLGSGAVSNIKAFMVMCFSDNDYVLGESMTTAGVTDIFLKSTFSYIKVVGPLFLVVLAASVGLNIAQVGFLYSSKAIGFKMSRLNPFEGIKRMVSLRSLVQLLKSILKTIIIGYIVYKEFTKQIGGIPGLIGLDLRNSISIIIDCILDIGFKAGIALAILGILDYLYQWWQYTKDLRMTKQEVKEEYKQMEGDPQIRGKIKERQRQIGMSRMMQSIPDADVVVTNPTHYAVAISYKQDEQKAPVVVAKGKDYIALKIREKAKEHNVEIVENREVARALYDSTEIGQEIPFELYQAVAEILAYVYRLKNQI